MYSIGETVRVTDKYSKFFNKVADIEQVVELGKECCYHLRDIPYIFTEDEIWPVNEEDEHIVIHVTDEFVTAEVAGCFVTAVIGCEGTAKAILKVREVVEKVIH
jgi:hypothetical protein